MARYQKAHPDMETIFRISVAQGGSWLWQGDGVMPRRTFFLWRSPAGIWHAFVQAPRTPQRFRHVAEGRTRSEAFDRASRYATVWKDKNHAHPR